jgi:hypothetical protein
MSYDKPNRIKYAFAFDAGGNGDEEFVITGPKGKAGRLWDYGVEGVTEAFTQDASLAVGTSSDPDAYGEELAMGALAVNTPKHVRGLYDEIADATSFDALMVERDIPKDTAVYLTVVDDASAGIGVFFAIVDWDD